MIKELKRDVRRLRKENAKLRESLRLVGEDRDRYRAWVRKQFKWFIELSAKQERPSLPWLINDAAALFNKSMPFYWG